jgi:hypothetical protein
MRSEQHVEQLARAIEVASDDLNQVRNLSRTERLRTPTQLDGVFPAIRDQSYWMRLEDIASEQDAGSSHFEATQPGAVARATARATRASRIGMAAAYARYGSARSPRTNELAGYSAVSQCHGWLSSTSQ